jgi:prepilin-type N-terminal cleavage/methylation domain-containing protein
MVTLKKRAFTLVELLTVIAIIALLIGILVPAVNKARQIAVKTSVKAQISGISTGLEMFKNDFGYYPSSVPQDTDGNTADGLRANADVTNTPVDGAHRLAYALVGRDLMGCPAKKFVPATASTKDFGPDSVAGVYYTSGTNAGTFNVTVSNIVASSSWGNDIDQKTTRKGPYIDPKGFGFVQDTTIDSKYAPLITDKYDKRTDDSITRVENYTNHSPILYYAANERGKYLYSGTTYTTDTASAVNIYYPQDNERIVCAGSAASATANFKNGYTNQNFFTFIEDTKALVGTTHRPVNPESFLLISRGFDGVYGTEDDVTNWEN